MNIRCWMPTCGALTALVLVGGGGTRAQVDIPSEPERPAPTASPDISSETPAKPREVLTPVQPDGPRRPIRQKLRVGPDVQVFFPTAGKTRDRYGDSWFGVGFGFGSVRPEGLLGRWSGEISLLHNKRTTRAPERTIRHEAYVIPVGIAYRRGLAKDIRSRPYVGASADLVLADFNSPTDGIGWGLRAGAGASLLGGVTFGTNGYIEARYLAASRVKGLDFSGLALNGGLRF